MPDPLDQLKQKYQPVLDTIQREGAELQNVSLAGNQLYSKSDGGLRGEQEPHLGFDQGRRSQL